jgi:hypothetical protein
MRVEMDPQTTDSIDHEHDGESDPEKGYPMRGLHSYLSSSVQRALFAAARHAGLEWTMSLTDSQPHQ